MFSMQLQLSKRMSVGGKALWRAELETDIPLLPYSVGKSKSPGLVSFKGGGEMSTIS